MTERSAKGWAWLITLGFVLWISAACQPLVVVVTATPDATSTLAAPVLTDAAPTAAPLISPVFTPTATATRSAPTPTQEILSPDTACLLFAGDYWDDPVDGCLKVFNGNFSRGVTGDGLPVGWLRRTGVSGIDSSCQLGACEFRPVYTQPMALTLYVQEAGKLGQRATPVEQGQCYLVKGVYSFRLLDTSGSFPSVVYAAAQIGNRTVVSQFLRGNLRPVPGDANFFTGGAEFVWPVRGGTERHPEIGLGVQVNWGVLASGNWVRLLGAYLFAAPENYCAGGAHQLP